MKVMLTTRNGDFVSEVALPPFMPPAEIVVWGQRYFVLSNEVQTADELVYREALPWYVPPPRPVANAG